MLKKPISAALKVVEVPLSSQKLLFNSVYIRTSRTGCNSTGFHTMTMKL